MSFCPHHETQGDSQQSTVDGGEDHRTNLPKTAKLARCNEQDEEETQLYVRTFIRNVGTHPFARNMYWKGKKECEKIKGGNGKGNQNRLKQGNKAEDKSWELSWLQ